MSPIIITSDIPENKVGRIIAAIKADNGTFERIVQNDGNVEIIATFPGTDLAPVLPPPSSEEFAWMTIARAEMGQRETAGARITRVS